jgi:putative membrane protein
MKYLISFIGSAVALFITANIVAGVEILSFQALIVATIIVGLINTFIRPILRLLTLPITLVTFGLFAIVVNAITFSLAAFFAPGFEIDGIITAFIGAIVLSIVSTVIDFITERMGLGKKKKES